MIEAGLSLLISIPKIGIGQVHNRGTIVNNEWGFFFSGKFVYCSAYCFFINCFRRRKISLQSGHAQNCQMEKQNEASQTIFRGIPEVLKWRVCQCTSRSVQTTSSCSAGQQIKGCTRVIVLTLIET